MCMFPSLVPRPSPFFVLFHLRVLYWTQTEEQKKRGRPGNEATCFQEKYYKVCIARAAVNESVCEDSHTKHM